MKSPLPIIILLSLLAGSLLDAAQSMTKVFDSYQLDAKHDDDTNYPVVGIGENSPLILKDGQVVESGRRFIRVKPKTQVNDAFIDILSMDEKRNEKAIVMKATLRSSVPMDFAYAIIVYKDPQKDFMRCRYSKLPPLTGEAQQVTLRFNSTDVPEKGWTLHFYDGPNEVYTDRLQDARDAEPLEAFVLHLGRHVRQVGSGDAGPAPFYVPVGKPDPGLLPEGDGPVTVRVKLTIKADGRIGEFSFPDPIDPALEKHVSGSIRQWLLIPRIKQGERVDSTVVFPLQLR